MNKKDLNEVLKKTRAFRPALSYQCDLNCDACYAKQLKGGKMDLNFFKQLLNEGHELGFNNVAFGGGEPLMEMALLKQCIHEARVRGYDTSITTNGALLTADIINELQDVGLNFFQLSLGFNRKSFAEQLRLLEETGACYGVNLLTDHQYVDLLPLIHSGLERFSVQYVVYILPKAMQPKTAYLKFSKVDVMRYLETLMYIKDHSSLPFLVDCVTNAIDQEMRCNGSERGITVSPDGKISFCAFRDSWVSYKGSLRTTLKNLDQQNIGKCTCLHKVLDGR